MKTAKKKTAKAVKKGPAAGGAPKAANPEVASLDALYQAVVAYVEARGGRMLVVGGVQVQEWPGGRPGQFLLAVECLGRKPNLVREVPRPPRRK